MLTPSFRIEACPRQHCPCPDSLLDDCCRSQVDFQPLCSEDVHVYLSHGNQVCKPHVLGEVTPSW